MLHDFKPSDDGLDKAQRKVEIDRLREKLAAQQQSVMAAKLPVVVLVEGWDCAGKGHLINELISEMDPRFYRVAVYKRVPENEERYPFLRKFFEPLPENGKFLFMDTGWMEDCVYKYLRREITAEEYERRVKLLRENMLTKSVTYNWHDSDTSYMEAVISRGDRRLCRVIETAWRKGEHLSAWEEYFSLDRWLEAFEECGLDPHFYANRKREKDELMPWSMISSGVTEQYLWREHERCYQSVTTPDCRTHCNGCGANLLLGRPCDG